MTAAINNGPTKFIIVRHGETIANRDHILQGWMESPLTENGIQQAKRVAMYLKNATFSVAYTSDLSRAVNTIQEILKFHPDIPLHLEPALREWNLGILQGQYNDVLWEKYPDMMCAFRNEHCSPDIPGGEKRSEFQQRITDIFRTLAERHPGETVLICTHGGALQRIFRMVTGLLDINNVLPASTNTSVSEIQYLHDKHKWQLLCWNKADHLTGLKLNELFTA
ncbi:MAG: histidine phosphatase family protein [Lentisphaeria bacterium]|nr:histidine phosphatase family protein [Lentisphaeria bacterium]